MKTVIYKGKEVLVEDWIEYTNCCCDCGNEHLIGREVYKTQDGNIIEKRDCMNFV